MNAREWRVYDAAPQMLEALKLVATHLEGTCVTVNDLYPLNRNPSSMMGMVIAAIEAAETKGEGALDKEIDVELSPVQGLLGP